MRGTPLIFDCVATLEGKAVQSRNDVKMSVIAEKWKLKFRSNSSDPQVIAWDWRAPTFEVQPQFGIVACGGGVDWLEFGK